MHHLALNWRSVGESQAGICWQHVHSLLQHVQLTASCRGHCLQ
jgi:hypothetical protein